MSKEERYARKIMEYAEVMEHLNEDEHPLYADEISGEFTDFEKSRILKDGMIGGTKL